MSKRSIKKYLFQKAVMKNIPISGTFELTPRCNLNCRMCYVRMTPEQQKCIGRELTTEEWLNIGRQAVENGMLYLLITGGEPLLRPDFLTIYTEMIKKGVIVSVNTNATCITQEVIACFKRYPPEQVNVTLYGSSAETYQNLCGVGAAFETAKKGILLLKESGIRVIINTTFTVTNKQDMQSLIAFAQTNEIPIRTAAYIFPKVRNGCDEHTVTLTPEAHGRLNAEFDHFTMTCKQIQARKKHIERCINMQPDKEIQENRSSSCMAGRSSFWISWNGKMYACGMLPDDRFDVISNSFVEGWKGVGQTVKEMYMPKECNGCRFESQCGVCAALTKSIHGNTAIVPREMCEYTQSYCHTFLDLSEDLSVGKL